jgi:hypothetical protein
VGVKIAVGSDHRTAQYNRKLPDASVGADLGIGMHIGKRVDEWALHHAMEPEAIEAGVLAMADDVWAWCEKTGGRGRTVTVKIKWSDFQQSTRSRSLGAPVDSRAMLHEATVSAP